MKRRINENDINNIVNKVVSEGSTCGIKGFFSGKGYNYSKYKYEINEVVSSIRKKLITDDVLESKLSEIYQNLKDSSATDYQKDRLENFIIDIIDVIHETNDKINNIIKDMDRW